MVCAFNDTSADGKEAGEPLKRKRKELVGTTTMMIIICKKKEEKNRMRTGTIEKKKNINQI